jgi:hypothetical protein
MEGVMVAVAQTRTVKKTSIQRFEVRTDGLPIVDVEPGAFQPRCDCGGGWDVGLVLRGRKNPTLVVECSSCGMGARNTPLSIPSSDRVKGPIWAFHRKPHVNRPYRLVAPYDHGAGMNVCCYCQCHVSDERGGNLRFDHVVAVTREHEVPKAKYSSTFAVSCNKCNTNKLNKMLWTEWTPSNPHPDLLEACPPPKEV